MHEASHMAFYLQLGGKWNRDIEININPTKGYVALGVLWDQKYGAFLDFCVNAAGVAADRIYKTSGYTGPGSDAYKVRDYAIDFHYKKLTSNTPSQN